MFLAFILVMTSWKSTIIIHEVLQKMDIPWNEPKDGSWKVTFSGIEIKKAVQYAENKISNFLLRKISK